QGAANEPKGQGKGKANKPKQLPKEQFRYVEAERAYYGPQGQRLPQVRQDTEKRNNGLELTVLVHQASGQDCQGCPRQPGCTRNPKKGRVVKRYQGEEALQRLAQRMKDPDSQ